MQYYGQIAPLDSHGVPGRYIWRHCLLYLNQPASVPTSRHDVNPDDCLGVVWLHNPSSANRPNPVPQDWGRIFVNPTGGDTLWTISTIMDAVADNVPENSIPQYAYLAIEELIYVDSTGVNDLWDSLTIDQVTRFSILNQADAGPIKLAYPRSKFVWVAWGEKSHNVRSGFVLPAQLTVKAMSLARESGRDLVGVGKRWDVEPNEYSAYRFAAAERTWTRYQNGVETQTAPATAGGFEFPLHPYDFGTMLRTWDCNEALRPAEDLVSALVKSIST